jgi:hypothetical protein
MIKAVTGLAVVTTMLLAAPAQAHVTAPTSLVVKSKTSSSVTLDWSQDYRDSYSGYYLRVDGGARIAKSSSDATVSNLAPGTHRFCVSINFTSSTHPDESDQTCIDAATTAPAPTPTPSPTATPTASPTPAPTATPSPTPSSGTPRFTWTRSSSSQAEFDTVAGRGFTHAMVDPDPAQMARVAAAGMRIVLWGGNYSDSCSWNWSDSTFDSKMSAASTSLYAGLVDYVFIADEPHAAGSGQCPNSPADMAGRHARSKSWFPNAETLLSENRKEDWPHLVNIADIFLPIIYPCNQGQTAGAGCNLSKISSDVATLRALNPTQWWATIHSFGEPSGEYYRMPTAAEEQAMYDRWHSLVDGDPKVTGWWNYTAGGGCCGGDIGWIDPGGQHLWPVLEAEND